MKSYEECEIANWLYLNGIEYEYERKYEHDTTTPERRQYKPDFYLPDLDVYVEHFAVDSNGNTPSFIDGQSYLEGISWKRATHEQFGTVLVETYSHEKSAGTLLSGLKAKLEALPGKVLRTDPVPFAAVWKRLEEKGRMDRLLQTDSTTFLRHFKGSQIRIEELRSRASSVSSHNRTIAYVDVFASIFEEYQRALKTQGDIDFEDMIALSTGYVATGRFVSPYGYILVDEFQDISVGRAKLLKALLEQRPNNQLFAVGDDWQAIFRFAGSDISLMRDFTANFGVTARTDLEETFRCVDRVSDVASKFVLRNRAQLAKTVRAVSKASGPSIFIGRPAAYGHGILRETLSRIVEHARGANVGVLLLGRYNNCKPKELRELQEAFPSLKLRFKSAHASKGLEDDYVVVLELKAERMGFPTGMVDDPLFDLVLAAPEFLPNAEERRLFYVALTHARRAVFLLADRSSPSPFVVELESGGYDVEIYGGNGQADDRCPNCKEGKLVIRRGSNGFFIGCSFYPLCEHKENVCPSCQLGAVQRQSRGNFVCTNSKCRREQRMCRCGQGWMQRINGVGGKPFLGCSNYPKCKYKENVQ